MGRNKSKYIDKADKKKLKDKSTVVSTIGHDPGTRNIRKADYSSISAKDRPNRHNNPRTGIVGLSILGRCPPVHPTSIS